VVAVALVGSYLFPQAGTIVQNLGAQPGPDSTHEYYSVNGLAVYKTRKALNAATTTPCAIKSPAATSTLVATGLQITTGSSTAVTYRVATSTTAFATTTSLNYFALASGAQGSFNLLSTTSNAMLIVPPSNYVVWGVEGTVIADATKLLGTCSAEFRVL